MKGKKGKGDKIKVKKRKGGSLKAEKKDRKQSFHGCMSWYLKTQYNTKCLKEKIKNQKSMIEKT